MSNRVKDNETKEKRLLNSQKKVKKDVSSKKLDKLIMLMIVFLAIMNIILTMILTYMQQKHDSISHYLPEYNEARIVNYNFKRDLRDIKREIKNKSNEEKNAEDKKTVENSKTNPEKDDKNEKDKSQLKSFTETNAEKNKKEPSFKINENNKTEH